LHGIVKAFSECRNAFYKGSSNFQSDYVFNNTMFRLGPNNTNYFDINALGNDANLEEIYALARLRYMDFWDQNRIKTCITLNREYNIDMDYGTYLTLRNLLLYHKRLNTRYVVGENSNNSLGTELARVKKHGKKLRLVLSKTERRNSGKSWGVLQPLKPSLE
jgi:hypothetical protein